MKKKFTVTFNTITDITPNNNNTMEITDLSIISNAIESLNRVYNLVSAQKYSEKHQFEITFGTYVWNNVKGCPEFCKKYGENCKSLTMETLVIKCHSPNRDWYTSCVNMSATEIIAMITNAMDDLIDEDVRAREIELGCPNNNFWFNTTEVYSNEIEIDE